MQNKRKHFITVALLLSVSPIAGSASNIADRFFSRGVAGLKSQTIYNSVRFNSTFRTIKKNRTPLFTTTQGTLKTTEQEQLLGGSAENIKLMLSRISKEFCPSGFTNSEPIAHNGQMDLDSDKKPFNLTTSDFQKDKHSQNEALIWSGYNRTLVELIHLLNQYKSDDSPSPNGSVDDRFHEMISFEQSSEALERLLSVIEEHSGHYQNGRAQISDLEYDFLKRKAANMRKKGILSRKDTDSQLEPINLNEDIVDCSSPEDLAAFFMDVKRNSGGVDHSFIFLPKVSGVSCELIYENGFLLRAYVSDFGENKLDISDLIRVMPSVPKTIKIKGLSKVSGRLYLDSRVMSQINYERLEQGLDPWIDTRSAIAYTLLNSTEPNKALKLKLKCAFHDFSNADISFQSLSMVLNLLDSNGFQTLKLAGLTGSYLRAPAIINSTCSLPCEITGVDIKINEMSERNIFKTKDSFLRKGVKIEQTTLEKIIFKVLKNGTIVACLYIKPIKFMGKTIRMFSVNNETSYSKFKFHEKDTIIIALKDKGAPELLTSFHHGNEPAVEFPSKCPKCSAHLAKKTVEGKLTVWCSTHLSCESDSSYINFIQFSGSNGFNIPSLSDGLVKELFDKFIISDVYDLFMLTDKDFELIESISSLEVKKLLVEIDKAKSITLGRFIYALNIPGVTFMMAEELAYATGSINRLEQMTYEDLSELEYVNKEAASNIRNFFLSESNRDKIRRLLEGGVIISEASEEINNLCFDDLSHLSKEKYHQIVHKIKQSNKNHLHLSDFDYDLLVRTAAKIEERYPDWGAQRNEKVLSEKSIVKLKDPFLKTKKTYSPEELRLFCKKIKDSGIAVEPKVNGIGCTIRYVNGKFESAYTKNYDGKVGNITDQIKNLVNIPAKLNEKFSGIIRGELFISDKDFSQINLERSKSGLDPYVDSLGAVNGFIVKKERNNPVRWIQFYAYYMDFAEEKDNPIDTQVNLHGYLQKLGFSCSLQNLCSYFSNPIEAVKYITDVQNRRDEFKTSIDGMLVKVDKLNDQTRSNSKHSVPKWALAYKFKLELLPTVLENVRFNMTKSGLLSTVGVLKPIRFSNGREVSSVSLPPRIVSELHEKDVVYVSYVGGVVPVIDRIVKNRRKENSKPLSMPTSCPECYKPLLQKKSGALECSNFLCTNLRDSNSIVFFAKGMQIGDKEVVQKLIDEGVVARISDFYRIIPETLSSILPQPQIQKLILDIEATKQTTIEQLLLSLPFNFVSRERLKILAKKLTQPSDLLNLTPEQLESYNFWEGPKIIEFVKAYEDDLKVLVNQNVGEKIDTKSEVKVIEIIDYKDAITRFVTKEQNVKVQLDNFLELIQKSMDENRHIFNYIGQKSDTEHQSLRNLVNSSQRTQSRFMRTISEEIKRIRQLPLVTSELGSSEKVSKNIQNK